MIKLDPIDVKLLELLQEDSKMNVKDISVQLKKTKTPIYERIKRFEREGIIKKYVAVLDRKKLETSMVVFCSVSLRSQKLQDLQSFSKAVHEIPEVVDCYLMGGAYDFLLRVVVKDLDAYHQFASGELAALPNVEQIHSTFVLDEVKRSTVFPLLKSDS